MNILERALVLAEHLFGIQPADMIQLSYFGLVPDPQFLMSARIQPPELAQVPCTQPLHSDDPSDPSALP